MNYQTIWNDNHDIAVLTWHGHTQSRPLDGLNHVLEKMYDQNIRAYLYEVWDDGQLLGMMVAGTLELDSDAEFAAIFRDVLTQNTTFPQTGEFAPQAWTLS